MGLIKNYIYPDFKCSNQNITRDISDKIAPHGKILKL